LQPNIRRTFPGDDPDDDDEQPYNPPYQQQHPQGKQLARANVGGKQLGGKQLGNNHHQDSDEEESDDDEDQQPHGRGGKQLRPAGGKYLRPEYVGRLLGDPLTIGRSTHSLYFYFIS
jgi:hypothetical protein